MILQSLEDSQKMNSSDFGSIVMYFSIAMILVSLKTVGKFPGQNRRTGS